MLVRSTRGLEYNSLFGMDFMIDRTPIDLAHAAMQTASEDTALRMQFYEKLVACELFLLLSEESKDDTLSPEVFDLTGKLLDVVVDGNYNIGNHSLEWNPINYDKGVYIFKIYFDQVEISSERVVLN